MVSHQDDVFIRTFFGVLGGLVLFAVIIYFIANGLGGGEGYAPAGNKMAEQQIAKEIAPVAQVNVAGASAAATSSGGGLTGEQIVKKTCSTCHGTGVAGAPKIGDHAEWKKRFDVGGLANLLKVAIHGKGAMPPRGGGGYKDAEMKKAIIYMLGKSGIKAGNGGQAQASGGNGGQAKAAGAGGGKIDLDKGKQLVGKVCAACHATGVAGAPKMGDHAEWKKRFDVGGLANLLKVAIHGKGAMPPRGGSSYNDQEMTDAIAYMLHKSGIDVSK
jgi:cytochrome c5